MAYKIWVNGWEVILERPEDVLALTRLLRQEQLSLLDWHERKVVPCPQQLPLQKQSEG